MRDLGLNQSQGLGLVQTYAYYCERCHYTWLPRSDSLFLVSENKHLEQKYNGQDLLRREPPKSCARCKSKQWRLPRQRQRRLKKKKE